MIVKKILTAIAAIGIAATSTTSLVSCGEHPKAEKTTGEKGKNPTPVAPTEGGKDKEGSTPKPVPSKN